MPGRIPDDVLESIRQRVSIVEIVSNYVSLKKSGRGYSGLCPFHNEKSPSFTVSEERGLFHCFGCGAGGNVFSFLMRIEKLEFREAVEQLAKRVNVRLPSEEDRSPAANLRNSLLTANQVAQEYFFASLRSKGGEGARRYAVQRGLRPDVAERYGLGFCPSAGGLVRALNSHRVSLDAAVQVGLLGRRADGSLFDRFWGRLMFPIRDTGGRVVGFGARAIGDQHPKYLNSPESALFRKGELLYGLAEARQAIREADRIVIVEGYLDALALVQAGIPNVVASLGTALGPNQLRLARRYASEVVTFFDGDSAGQQAASRAFAVCAEIGIWGLGAFLPQGVDPDTYVREHGAAATLAILQHAIPLADFFLQRMDPGANATVPQRVRAAHEVAEVLDRIEDLTQFSVLAQRASQVLRVDEEIFRRRRTAGLPARIRNGSPTPVPEVADAAYRSEELVLVEVMALDGGIARAIAAEDVLAHFESQDLAQSARRILDAWNGGLAIDGLVDQLPSPLAARLRAALLGAGPVSGADLGKIARDCVARIEERHHRAHVRALRSQVQQAEARGDVTLLETLRDQLRQRRDSGTVD